MLEQFFDFYFDCPEKRHVILYLQGGHVIDGYLDFEGYARYDDEKQDHTPLRPENQERERALEKGLIEMDVNGHYFRTHASLVVGFTFVDEDLEEDLDSDPATAERYKELCEDFQRFKTRADVALYSDADTAMTLLDYRINYGWLCAFEGQPIPPDCEFDKLVEDLHVLTSKH